MNEHDLLPGFREALVGAARRANQRRARRRGLVRRSAVTLTILMLVGSLGAGAFLINSAEPVGADVVVSRVGGDWHVTVTSSEVTAAQIEAALQDSGINADVSTVPVGPSRVGEFVSGDANVALAGDDPESSETVIIPTEADGVHLFFGTSAERNESYAAFSDAFAVGEPLECLPSVQTTTAAEAIRVIEARIDDVYVVSQTGEELADVPSGTVVLSVLMLSPERARVTVGDVADASPPGTRPQQCPG